MSIANSGMDYAVGDRVRITGLRNQLQFNGCTATIQESYGDGKLRVRIQVVDGDRELKLSVDKVELLERSEPREDAESVLEVMQATMVATSMRNLEHCPASYTAGIRAFEHSLELAQRTGIELLQSSIFEGMGLLHLDYGHVGLALPLMKKAVNIQERIGDASGLAHMNASLGEAYFASGQHELALDKYKSALATFLDTGDMGSQGRVYSSLAITYSSLRQYDVALKLEMKCIEIKKKMGERMGEGRGYRHLGKIYCALGQYEKAQEMLVKVLSIFETIEPSTDRMFNTVSSPVQVQYELIRSYSELADVEHHLGHYDNALAMHAKAQKVRQSIGDRNGVAESYLGMGKVYMSKEQYDMALEMFSSALEIHQQIGEVKGAGRSYQKLGWVYFKLKRYDEARSMNLNALEISKRINEDMDQAIAYENMAHLDIELGKFESAVDFLSKSLGIYQSTKEEQRAGDCSCLLGDVYSKLGRRQSAIQSYEEARQVFDRIGNAQAADICSVRLNEIIENPAKDVKFEDLYDVMSSGNRLPRIQCTPKLPEERARLQAASPPKIHNTNKEVGEDNFSCPTASVEPQACGHSGNLSRTFANVIKEVGEDSFSCPTVSVEPQDCGHNGQSAQIYSAGDRVRITALKNQPRFNGCVAMVQESYADGKLRVRVIQGPAKEQGLELKLSAEKVVPAEDVEGAGKREIVHRNFSDGDRVRITALKNQPWFNGCVAMVQESYADGKLRVRVIQGPAKGLELKLSAEKVVPAEDVEGAGKREIVHEVNATAVGTKDLKSAILAAEALRSQVRCQKSYQAAVQSYQHAVDLARGAGHKQLQGVCLQGLGLVHLDFGQIDQALPLVEQSLEIRQQIGDSGGEGCSLHTLGEIHHTRKEFSMAIDRYRSALSIFQRLQLTIFEGKVTFSLGLSFASLAQYESAEDMYIKAIGIKQELGDDLGAANACETLAKMYREISSHEKASEMLLQAISAYDKAGNRKFAARAYLELATIQRSCNKFQESLATSTKALAITQELGHESGVAEAYLNIGDVYISTGQYEIALATYSKALESNQHNGAEFEVGKVFLKMGATYFLLHSYDKALDMSSKAHNIFERLGELQLQGEALVNQGHVHLVRKNAELAVEILQKSLQLFQPCSADEKRSFVFNLLGHAYNSMGRHDRALEAYSSALEASKLLGNQAEIQVAYAGLTKVYSDLGQYDKAYEVDRIKQETLFGGSTIELGVQSNVGPAVQRGQISSEVKDALTALLVTHIVPPTFSISSNAGLDDIVSNGIRAKCPKGHVLQKRDSDRPYICDVCNRSWLRGQRLSCKISGCDYNACRDCWELLEKQDMLNEAQRCKPAQTSASKQVVEDDVQPFSDDAIRWATTLSLQSIGKYKEAKCIIDEALNTAEGTAVDRQKCLLYCQSSQQLFLMGQYESSLEMASKSLHLSLKIGNLELESMSYTNAGECYRAQAKYAEAIEMFNKSLAICTGLYENAGKELEKKICMLNIGTAYLNLGSVYYNVGQHETAIDMHSKALVIAQTCDDKSLEGKAVGNLGTVYYSSKQYNRAMEMLQKSLEIKKICNDVRGQGKTLQSLGNVHLKLQQYDVALECFSKSLEIRQNIGDIQGEGRLCTAIGRLYVGIGQPQLALESYLKCLDISKRIGDLSWQMSASFCAGECLCSIGDVARALEYFERSLDISEVIQKQLAGRDRELISMFETLRQCYVRLQESLILLERDSEALAISERGKARALQQMLAVQADQRMPDAKNAFQVPSEDHCLQLSWENIQSMVRDEAATIVEYSLLSNGTLAIWVVSDVGDLLAARKVDLGKQLFEYLLHPITNGDWQSLSEIQKLELFNLLDTSHLKSTRASLKTLLNLTRCSLGATPTRSQTLVACKLGVDETEEITEKAQLLESRTNEVLARNKGKLHLLTSRCPKGHALQLQRAAGPYICEKCHANVQDFADHLCCKRGLCDFNICPTCTLSSNAKAPDLPDDDDEEAQQEAKSLLEGHKDICVWMRILSFCKLPPEIDRDEFLDALEAVRTNVMSWQDLRNTTDAILKDGCRIASSSVRGVLLTKITALFDEDTLLHQLFTMLIEPIYDLLPPDSELLIIPDVELFLVPWAGLKDPAGKYLMEKFSIRLAPSLSVCRKASADAILQRKVPKACVVGDPWPLQYPDFGRLKHSIDEANAVAAHFRAKPLIGPEASKEKVMDFLSSADFAHLACHGWLEKQALVLAKGAHDDGLLSAGDVQDKLKLSTGCTVVLSACNSARGEVKGEGVVGLSRAFFAAGASCVVMSLWSIPDEGTKLLMDAMYFALELGHSMTLALRFAMNAMLKHRGLSPLSWAGFVVAGANTKMSPDLSGFSVSDMAALWERCGLDPEPVTSNQMDGKTFLSLSDSEVEEGLELSKDQVRRLLLSAVAAKEDLHSMLFAFQLARST